jgi:hypothetical protein
MRYKDQSVNFIQRANKCHPEKKKKKAKQIGTISGENADFLFPEKVQNFDSRRKCRVFDSLRKLRVFGSA